MQFFIVCQVECYRNILKLSCRLLAFTSYKAFWKNKKRNATSLCLILCMIFEGKYFSCNILSIGKISFSGCLYFLLLGNKYCNCLLTKLWSHKFWNLPDLSNQALFSTRPKSQNKNLNISGRKRAFKIK